MLKKTVGWNGTRLVSARPGRNFSGVFRLEEFYEISLFLQGLDQETSLRPILLEVAYV